ncbi:hypothetical protein D9M72_537830 [compost metagenome]
MRCRCGQSAGWRTPLHPPWRCLVSRVRLQSPTFRPARRWSDRSPACRARGPAQVHRWQTEVPVRRRCAADTTARRRFRVRATQQKRRPLRRYLRIVHEPSGSGPRPEGCALEESGERALRRELRGLRSRCSLEVVGKKSTWHEQSREVSCVRQLLQVHDHLERRSGDLVAELSCNEIAVLLLDVVSA